MSKRKPDLSKHIEKLLEKENRWWNNDKLNKTKLSEAIREMDPELLKNFLKDDRIKSTFFTDIEGISVFDKSAFLQWLNTAEVLPNSYTSYLNKIGLWSGEKNILSRNDDVVLVWPYKDCVLEGGQTKEDVRKEERFYNEILAKEEIDRLLDPKVFTGFKLYDQSGPQLPVQLDDNSNFILRGNNLIVMHSLKKRFTGKVKLIYIDPPYNTGSDSFVYHDSFSHSTWLTFMKNRLEIAWKLLASDGCIFIQTDDSEFAYLKVLCDEIFGRDKFKEHIVLKSSSESGVNAINVKNGERLFKVKENILFYAKSPGFRFKPFYTKAAYNMNYKYEVIQKNGKYSITNIYKKFADEALQKAGKTRLTENELHQVNRAFEDYALAHSEHIFSLEKNIKKAGEKFKSFAAQNEKKETVEEFVNSKGATVLIYKGGVLVPLKERIINENGKNYFGVLASDLWVDIGTTAASEGGIQFQNGKKPERLLRRIIEMTTEVGDLVLDYHLGSGTTAAVAHKLGRKYIGIEQMDYGENDSVVRLQNVIHGDASGISKSVNWCGGGSFVYAELKKWNEEWLQKIMKATSKRDLVRLKDSVLENAFINFSLDEAAFSKNSEAFSELNLEDQKKILIEILDKNLLYIPVSEMEDAQFGISDSEKILNKAFYQTS